jgi:hypothetical protein
MAENTIHEVVAAFDEPEALHPRFPTCKATASTGPTSPSWRASRSPVVWHKTMKRPAAQRPLRASPRRDSPFATGGGTLVAAGVTAAAVGAVGGVGALLGKAYGKSQHTFLREQLERGGILVWVRTPDPAAEERAQFILRKYSAHDVHVHEVPASV